MSIYLGTSIVKMLDGYNSLIQSLLGTGLTWGLTAAGAALVFVFQGGKVRILKLDEYYRLLLQALHYASCRGSVRYWMEAWGLQLG